VLILDEPTTAIDPLGVTEILDLLRALVKERQMAILLSSHLLNQVQSVCDRIGIFAAGRLIGQGTMDELAARFGDDTAHVEAGFEPGPADDTARIEGLLAAIPGVIKVRVPDQPRAPWVVDVKPASVDTGVRRAIVGAAATNGLDLTSVRAIAP